MLTFILYMMQGTSLQVLQEVFGRARKEGGKTNGYSQRARASEHSTNPRFHPAFELQLLEGSGLSVKWIIPHKRSTSTKGAQENRRPCAKQRKQCGERRAPQGLLEALSEAVGICNTCPAQILGQPASSDPSLWHLSGLPLMLYLLHEHCRKSIHQLWSPCSPG